MPDGGYGELLTRMAHGLRVRHRVLVSQVDYELEGGGARVVATHNGKEAIFDADAVLMTAPLGVLQARRLRPRHHCSSA